LRAGLGLGLAMAFLWLVLRHLDYAELTATLASARYGGLVLALLAFAAGYACRIARWRQMLARDNPALRWRDCAGPLLASFAANNVLPFRAGDLMRAVAFNSQLRVGAGTVLASLWVERLLDLLMLLAALGLALAVFGLGVSQLLGVGALALVALAAGIAALLLVPGAMAPLAALLTRGFGRLSPVLAQRLTALIAQVMEALYHFAGPRQMGGLLFWSAAAWLAEGAVFWCVAVAVPAVANPTAAWLALPVGTLATLIPSTPGYVGTFDYFVAQALMLLGNAPPAATAFALLVHALLWLPPTVVGGIYLLLRSGARPRTEQGMTPR
jgi:uncharacterized protein (TIRG00374 family)